MKAVDLILIVGILIAGIYLRFVVCATLVDMAVIYLVLKARIGHEATKAYGQLLLWNVGVSLVTGAILLATGNLPS